MKPFQHLLVTTDLSEMSAAAAELAVEIARAAKSKVTVLHVVQTLSEIYPHFTPPTEIVVQDAKIRDAASRELAVWSKKNLRGVDDVEMELRTGDPSEKILEAAEELGTTAIVMTTQGLAGLKRLMVGSVTERVLREAGCPVLVVPPKRA